ELRLAEPEAVKRKHGGSIEAALEERQRLETQLGATEDLESALASAQTERAGRRESLEAAAARLSSARAGSASRLAKAVAAELEGLRLGGSRSEIALRPRAGSEP